MQFFDYFKIIKHPKNVNGEICLFSVVGNEIYLLPYFLEHYRKIGFSKFYFLVDKSNDGTQEYLISQNDCGVITSSLQFGDTINFKIGNIIKKNYRIANFFRYFVPYNLFQHNWVLTADADEFLILPRQNEDIYSLASDLKNNNLKTCRAIMVDMFPKTLSELDYNLERHPLEICRYFNPPVYKWLDKSDRPEFYDHSNEIRMKLNEKLLASLNTNGVNHGDKISQITLSGPLMYKSPLNFWTKNTFADTHHTNHQPSKKIQASFLHFHFHDKLVYKVRAAIRNQQYYRKSANYVTLDYAFNFCREMCLPDKHSIEYTKNSNFWDLGLSFNNLKNLNL